MSAVMDTPSPQPSPARGRGSKRLNPKYLPLAATISLFMLMFAVMLLQSAEFRSQLRVLVQRPLREGAQP